MRVTAPARRPATPSAPAHRHVDQATRIARFLDRIAALTPTEIDRLALAEPPPIAFGATIRRFLPPEQRAALDEVEAAVDGRLPPGADRPTIRDAIDGYATELVLGRFLDELLTEPFRERAHERLTRGWDAAVGQPRYGPNSAAVEALVERIGRLDRPGLERLAETGADVRGAPEPWPPDVSPGDEDALRISAILAARDAAAAVPPGLAAAERSKARLAAGRLAHLLVLRHAFAPAAFDGLTGPWRPWLLPERVGSACPAAGGAPLTREGRCACSTRGAAHHRRPGHPARRRGLDRGLEGPRPGGNPRADQEPRGHRGSGAAGPPPHDRGRCRGARARSCPE